MQKKYFPTNDFSRTGNSDHPEAPFPAATVAWYTTILLAVLYWLSVLDRFIISLLVEPIKKDLDISDVQFAMLHGMAFAITFSLFGLIAGSLADRFNRRWIIFASVSIWSVATAFCGMAQQFWHLLLARVGVGAGEAGLTPCATSMISDLFPRSRLTLAMAVYAIGSSVGSGCAYLFGGLIVSMVAQADTIILPIVGEIRSWQAVFFIVGVPGALVAFLVFTLQEPVRRERSKPLAQQSFWSGTLTSYVELIRLIRTKGNFFLFHYLGFGVATVVVAGSGPWYPAHMGRTFGWNASQIGLSLGLTLVFTSLTGKLISGYFVDLMYRRGYRDAQFRWCAGVLLAAAPCGIASMISSNPWVFFSGLSLFLMLTSTLPACANAALNLVTPNELRGTGVAFYSSTCGLLGISLGPLLVAGASDYIFGGNAIGYGLATVIAVCCPLSALFLWWGRGAMSKAVQEAES